MLLVDADKRFLRRIFDDVHKECSGLASEAVNKVEELRKKVYDQMDTMTQEDAYKRLVELEKIREDFRKEEYCLRCGIRPEDARTEDVDAYWEKERRA